MGPLDSFGEKPSPAGRIAKLQTILSPSLSFRENPGWPHAPAPRTHNGSASSTGLHSRDSRLRGDGIHGVHAARVPRGRLAGGPRKQQVLKNSSEFCIGTTGSGRSLQRLEHSREVRGVVPSGLLVFCVSIQARPRPDPLLRLASKDETCGRVSLFWQVLELDRWPSGPRAHK